MRDVYTPTKARADFYNLIKEVNNQSRPITIVPATGEENASAVLISKRDYEAQQETMALLANGELQFALKHKDDTDTIDANELTRLLDAEGDDGDNK
ncbi:type II toxin-antitoxin system Phd/YefM family antitoxin [Schleiferilactobacillus perolens]|uniref:Antitoxin n=1 Tax=Schleiferilactobacillus perolens DSM 12744 TaxID=1423792 RepID=A0A0R1MVK6_9LACO|nr:type II toxin-antitoxin system prevent-host-death family antitoxin [Schleiferilactobacillus perolens]KRL11932.1 hypothetical protein FD09_GL000540 [Schleiferilactobacillus perolens DSM 12744]